MTDKKSPNLEEVQREFENFVKQRFGESVQIFTKHMNPSQSDSNDHNTDSENDGTFDFHFTPKAIKEYLDRYVIRQDEAKIALAIAVCDHYNHIKNCQSAGPDLEYSKQNVLILGPTGVGKTYLIRKIAELIGVPFIKADATRFSETGYVGANVDDLIRDLVTQADGDIEKAQYGIIYLDEADKLASPSGHSGRDVTGRGVQFGLLKLMEEAEVDLAAGNDFRSQMQALMDLGRKGKAPKVINTGKILFIVSGAFTGLADLISKRLNTQSIGFHKDHEQSATRSSNLLQQATTKDFIDYGFEPEFIGRLPVRVACDHLTADDLYRVLKDSSGSIVRQYIAAFKAYGITLRFSDEALLAIAKEASTEKTGARGLITVCEKILRNFKFELPSSSIKEFTVTAAVTKDPAGQLAELLQREAQDVLSHLHEEVRAYEKTFFLDQGMKIQFDDEATQMIAERVSQAGITVDTYCSKLLQGYEYGLKLLQQSTGQKFFKFTKDTITNPKDYLEGLIRSSFLAQKGLEKSPKPSRNDS